MRVRPNQGHALSGLQMLLYNYCPHQTGPQRSYPFHPPINQSIKTVCIKLSSPFACMRCTLCNASLIQTPNCARETDKSKEEQNAVVHCPHPVHIMILVYVRLSSSHEDVSHHSLPDYPLIRSRLTMKFLKQQHTSMHMIHMLRNEIKMERPQASSSSAPSPGTSCTARPFHHQLHPSGKFAHHQSLPGTLRNENTHHATRHQAPECIVQ